MLLEGIIRGLEVISDVLEFGMVDAVKINTAFIPEAERDSRRVIRNINKSLELPSNDNESESFVSGLETYTYDTSGEKDVDLEKFGALVEDIKAVFSMASDNIDLRLIYEYDQLNAYGKVIMDRVNSNRSDWSVALNKGEQFAMAMVFKEQCQRGEGDKYAFIFWALMLLTVDDRDKEKYLSQICDFSTFLEINDEEVMNLIQLIRIVYRNKF